MLKSDKISLCWGSTRTVPSFYIWLGLDGDSPGSVLSVVHWGVVAQFVPLRLLPLILLICENKCELKYGFNIKYTSYGRIFWICACLQRGEEENISIRGVISLKERTQCVQCTDQNVIMHTYLLYLFCHKLNRKVTKIIQLCSVSEPVSACWTRKFWGEFQ